MAASEELILLERVFLRLGTADTDEQLESAVMKFLPPVILKMSSPNPEVHAKVMELLPHINKRIKNRPSIQLPVEALIFQLQDSTNAYVINFTNVYLRIGFPRLSDERQSQLLPNLVNAAEGKQLHQQESLVCLVIAALEKVRLPRDDLEAKAFLGLSEKPAIRKLFLDVILDLFLLPYGWTSNKPPSELSVYGLKRLVDNFTGISDPTKLEQMKLTLVKFLSCGVFGDDEMLTQVVVGTGDARSTVCTAAEMQLRKIIGSVKLDEATIVVPLYQVYLGGGKDDFKRGPARTRLLLKILPVLSRAQHIAWPLAIRVLFDSLYGENTNTKLKSLGLSFFSSILQHVNKERLVPVGKLLLESGLLKLLSEESDHLLLRQGYSVMGQLVVKLPNLVRNDLSLVERLFEALDQEAESEMQLCIRDAMVAMCGSYKNLSDALIQGLAALLSRMLDSPAPKCRSVAIHYIATSLPKSANQLYTLLSAATHLDEDVSTEAKKALYGPCYKTPGKGDNLSLPSFEELLTLILEKETSKQVDPKLHSEMLFYLRLCLANASGVKATLEQVAHPCESSVPVSDYLRRLHARQPLLILQYVQFICRLLDTEVGVVPLSSLLECVGCLPDILIVSLQNKTDLLKNALGESKEEIRELSAQLLGLLTPADSVEASCLEYCAQLEGNLKDVEKTHGSMLALGHTVERSARAGKPLTATKPAQALVKMLESSQNILVSGACLSLGLIAQSQSLPLTGDEKSKLTDSLLSIVLGTKHTSKVKDRACSTLGSLCIGEDYLDRERIIVKFMDSAKEVKEIELHLSIGECLVSSILGATSSMSIDPWKRNEAAVEEYKRNILSEDLKMKSKTLASVLLSRVLSASSTPHPHLRQSCCFWLLAVTKHCDHVETVQAKLPEIQAAFMDLLSDSSGLVQEGAGKGLALVYQNSDESSKSELLSKVVEQLTVGRRSVNKVSEDTKIFQEGELGKAPSGGGLSTYKELCALASDLNQPDLIYKFMHLANHNAVWNSKKGAAYGVSSLVTMAGNQMDAHLPKIVAKLYRYQYDPTPSIQQSMTTIWHSMTSSTPNAVERYHKEIFDDLLTNLTAGQWRVRMSCCQALSDFMRGSGSKIFEDCVEKIPELWKQLFRVMDDIHEGTRESATSTTKILSKICVRRCDKEAGKSADGLSAQILPVLLEIGIKHNVSEIRSVSVATLSEMVKNGVSERLVTSIVPALLMAAAELESTSLNALSVMYSASSHTQDAIDSVRASAVKSHFTVQTLARIVDCVKPHMMEELSPPMLEMLRSSVGLGSRIATAHFLVLLSHHLTTQDLQPFIGKFLGALLNGISDRNAAIRKNYATTIGQLTRCAKDSSVDRLLAKLSTLYFEKEDEGIRSAICYTLQAMVTHSQDSVKNRPDLTLPLVFFAKHQEKNIDGSNKTILETWEEVWEEVCSTQNTLVLNEEHICAMLEQCLTSQAWTNKAQAARAIKTLSVKVGDRLSEERRKKLVTLLVTGLSGRTWDGKEHLLDALSSTCKHAEYDNETKSTVIDAVLKECNKEKINYKCYALRSLAEILNTLQEDRFESVHPLVMAIINKNIENEIDESDDKEESSKKRQELTQLREAAYETLGKSWPLSPHTQEIYRESVIEICVKRLDKSTRGEQVKIMSTLVMLTEKLYILNYKTNKESDAESLKRILDNVHEALDYSLGIPKHTILRKESLNLIFQLSKHLKIVNEAEHKRLKLLFERNSEVVGRDTAPEVKSRYLDIRDSFSIV